MEKRARVVRKNINAEKRLLEQFVYHLYVNEDNGATALKILLGPQENSQKMLEIRYLSYISKSRKKLISNLRDSLTDLATITDEKKATESKLLKIKTMNLLIISKSSVLTTSTTLILQLRSILNLFILFPKMFINLQIL